MEAMRSICVGLSGLLVMAASTISIADVITIDRNSRGSYDSAGNTNESGYINEFPAGLLANGLEARNWLRFDIPLLHGQAILDATIRVDVDFYISPDSSEEYRLRHVSSDPNQLGFFSGTDVSREVFEDLGSGVVYGAVTVTETDEVVSIELGSAAMGVLNALAHGPGPSGGNGNWFVVGGSITTLGAFRGVEAMFCSPNNCPLLDVRFNTNNVTELILAVTPPPPATPMAEPPGYLLLLAGFLALALRRRDH